MKNSSPIFSVITASYNYEKYIEQTINSVVKQTFKNFEIIIADDGSTDNSVQIIQNYAEKYPNIKFFTHANNQNLGLAETLKMCIEKANGKYIAFLESDDFWHEDYLQEKFDIFSKNEDIGLVFNKVKPFGDENKMELLQGYFEKCENICQNLKLPANITKYLFSINLIPTFSCWSCQKTLLENCNFNSTIPPFLDYWILAQLSCKTNVAYIDKPLTNWRLHPKSFISETKQKNFNKKTFTKNLLAELKKINPQNYMSILESIVDYKKNNFKKPANYSTNFFKNKKTYLYGAGEFAKNIIKTQDLSDLNILGIFDADINKKESKIENYDIFHKSQIPDLNPDVIILALAEPDLIESALIKEFSDKDIQFITNYFTQNVDKNYSLEEFIINFSTL